MNEYGKIAFEEWIKLADRFPNFELDTFQIMPNHMHSIISLRNINPVVESTVDIISETPVSKINETPVGKINETPVGAGFTPAQIINNDFDFCERATARVAPTGAAKIGDIIGAYKSLVANACLNIYKSKNEQMGKFWQRDYYDIIIRSEQSYLQISNYIKNNPKNWKKDKFYQK